VLLDFGFIALVPGLIRTEGSKCESPPVNTSPRVGARVASLRSPILRPGQYEVYLGAKAWQ
jgi:hypothetical protein